MPYLASRWTAEIAQGLSGGVAATRVGVGPERQSLSAHRAAEPRIRDKNARHCDQGSDLRAQTLS
jgi:hypothetical protein